MSDQKDFLAEFDAMFANFDVPSKVKKPKKAKEVKERTVKDFAIDKIAIISNWIEALNSNEPRIVGRGAKKNLSNVLVDPAFVSVRLPHGPAGNLKMYFKGEWKPDHIIPAAMEVDFWKLTITAIERGIYDTVFEDAMKALVSIHQNADGTPKVRAPRGSKKKKQDA